MKKTYITLLLVLFASAAISSTASYASYRYRKNGFGAASSPAYSDWGPFGFDTVLSPMSAFCDCLVSADVLSGKTTAVTTVDYEAVAVNTAYLSVPTAAAALLFSRYRKARSGVKG